MIQHVLDDMASNICQAGFGIRKFGRFGEGSDSAGFGAIR